jgi:hypothetical protein
MPELDELLDRQDGVIARRQALACGLTPTAINRNIRRRAWTPVHPGVYVTHTGPLTWQQRAWAAVLACWPAVLDGRSALRAHEGPGRHGVSDSDPIEVVVANERRITAPAGVRVRRSRRFDEAIQGNLSPPRLRYEATVIDLADRAADLLSAIAVIADACGGRRTTAGRLRRHLDQLARVRRRSWLAAILDDVSTGTCSVLEHAYLTDVERPHGLPRARRQVTAVNGSARNLFRDVRYGGIRPRWRLIVELDGRLFHSSARARDRDLERDLDAAIDREETVRIGYGQVFGRPCRTAAKMARLMQRLGWRGEFQPCPRCPIELQRGGLVQPG